MKEILIETGSCLVAAMLLMIWHEVIRLIVYACCQRSVHCFRTTPWKVWRYIDPIGLILSLTSCVPISKPYFYRVRDPITNRRLGVAGLVSLHGICGQHTCSTVRLRRREGTGSSGNTSLVAEYCPNFRTVPCDAQLWDVCGKSVSGVNV